MQQLLLQQHLLYLNTSHVKVNQIGHLHKENICLNLNTSHVKVNRQTNCSYDA